MKKNILITIGLLLLLGIFYFVTKEPPQYTAEEWKAMSIKEASKRLDTYVEQEGLNRSDFSGPYVKKSDNPNPPTFMACYKSITHYFCYIQGSDMDFGYSFSEVSCKSDDCQWLKSLP